MAAGQPTILRSPLQMPWRPGSQHAGKFAIDLDPRMTFWGTDPVLKDVSTTFSSAASLPT